MLLNAVSLESPAITAAIGCPVRRARTPLAIAVLSTNSTTAARTVAKKLTAMLRARLFAIDSNPT